MDNGITSSTSIQRLTASPIFNLCSQGLRIAGCSAALLHWVAGTGNPLRGELVLAATALSRLRLPFHGTVAAQKAVQACDRNQEAKERLSAGLTALFLGSLSLYMAWSIAELLLASSAGSALLGAALPYLDACDVGYALWSLEKRSSREELDLSLNFIAVLAVTHLSPLPGKELIDSLSGLYLGGTSFWTHLDRQSMASALGEEEEVLEPPPPATEPDNDELTELNLT